VAGAARGSKAMRLALADNMAMYGMPGLSFMLWHQIGETDGSHADPAGDYAGKFGTSTGHQ
jgi:hypothetical protein